MKELPSLIVGLGNPGAEHNRDRHNVGFWLADELADGVGFNAESKLLGDACQVAFNHHKVRILKPSTFMNRSGQSMRRTLDYFKLAAECGLVIHDDLDLPPGTARLKVGGGHGGHNGLRDIITHCGRDFLRLRIGIGHPGRKEQVVGYVLRPPGKDELPKIRCAIDEGRRAIDILYADGLEAAMKYLHTATPPQDVTRDLGPAG
ncbi:MAG: aminoacyl-tRNA hydrolase [Gammaproteobacteria bacterium]|jgi:PTH1 family peptidyl-tRNA hydrolase|nr:aminoacyl-tRNA hydrolase [Gammaproteobacteria bacterium]MDP7420054.1 aminoacyl-tRNA hydrolase [Gammaproteobacteria bacterium]